MAETSSDNCNINPPTGSSTIKDLNNTNTDNSNNNNKNDNSNTNNTNTNTNNNNFNTNNISTVSSNSTINSQKPKKKKYVPFGPYILSSTLGEGEFGKVKLGWSKASTQASNEIPKQVAIKLIKRSSILPKGSNKEIKVYREINALKQLCHPNIVKLDDVLQNSKYIGIVLEYASGGEFYKYIQRKKRLKEINASKLFSQLISGVHYMHSKGLVHRDLKLENLLLDKHENLIITDFGFVNEFFQTNELMLTPCGSPCYAAPELVISKHPYEARKADLWSCGIILYAMLAGYLPWDDDIKNPDGNDIARLYYYITTTPLKFPEYIQPLPRDLLRKILVPNYKKRINMRRIINHEWLKPHFTFLSIAANEWDKMIPIRKVLKNSNQTVGTHSANNSFVKINALSTITKTVKERSDSYSNAVAKSRPLSVCSTNSVGLSHQNRDSLIIDSTLIPLPAPPQESQSHAIVNTSTSSSLMDITYSNKLNKLNNNVGSSNNISNSNTNIPKYIRGHKRGNSAASIALQAMIDSENEREQSKEGDFSNPGSKTTHVAVTNSSNINHNLTTNAIPSNINSSGLSPNNYSFRRYSTSPIPDSAPLKYRYGSPFSSSSRNNNILEEVSPIKPRSTTPALIPGSSPQNDKMGSPTSSIINLTYDKAKRLHSQTPSPNKQNFGIYYHYNYQRSSSQRVSNNPGCVINNLSNNGKNLPYSNTQHNKPRPTSYYPPSRNTSSINNISSYLEGITTTSEISLINMDLEREKSLVIDHDSNSNFQNATGNFTLTEENNRPSNSREDSSKTNNMDLTFKLIQEQMNQLNLSTTNSIISQELDPQKDGLIDGHTSSCCTSRDISNPLSNKKINGNKINTPVSMTSGNSNYHTPNYNEKKRFSFLSFYSNYDVSKISVDTATSKLTMDDINDNEPAKDKDNEETTPVEESNSLLHGKQSVTTNIVNNIDLNELDEQRKLRDKSKTRKIFEFIKRHSMKLGDL
ncbi:hypothetical protein TBLA_0C01750 [Henningerozyma blattae CBS 6284]|uniref:non-specific serine/threonine protein kinase n=1 Tax=Henningerozyma blattae (strain ATCC 34711 / CBS 6284 / DSM 70876 / NBRC 10599 / NRRL Y-10934 / UCD 77-7) TaxID=1071380 RepID=I2H0T7_HENB6|nr:hypothetical protein TBLA_0C01750 [Tetrapisispora blattae CBS 6284]CCH59989.1 hypothetical protein TBLA_0C01750 [Tetrapisispora blattae CBS 6284]